MTEPPELRIDYDSGTGRPVLVAPQRRHRPMHTHGHAVGPCPFCPGEEHQTPPEVDAVRDGGEPDRPGWRVRAFANLYPAARDHEVIVEGPAHEIRPGAVAASVWSDAFAVYRRRIAALEARDGVRCAFLFKNVGREAGASIPHNHSQLIGLPMLPPRLEVELAHARRGCVVCRELEGAERAGRVVAAGAHHIALCPSAPKLPHETWVLPREHGADFLAGSAEATGDLAALCARVFGAVDRALGGSAFNFYLHRVPREDFHWHFELQPRTGFLAGLELGGDMYINSISAPEAAARLRGGC